MQCFYVPFFFNEKRVVVEVLRQLKQLMCGCVNEFFYNLLIRTENGREASCDGDHQD